MRRRHSHGRNARRGLSQVDVLAIIAVVVIAGIAGAYACYTAFRNGMIRNNVPVQMQGIQQGLFLFAQSNRDRYPLPSELDRADATIALASGADPRTKDTSANIISVLIYTNHVGPESCRSMGETNPEIRRDEDYQYKTPKAAIDPAKALWDPAFSADFTAPGGGNLSFAHMLPSGKRLEKWANWFDAKTAIVGDRGPAITAVRKGASPDVKVDFRTPSNTLRFYGRSGSWRGNIVYNDNHAEFHDTMWNATLPYSDAAGVVWNDLFHSDEVDDASGLNAFLGIFTQAGPTPAAFKAIWD